MKKTLISLGVVVLTIVACGTQTTQPTTSVDPPTQAQAQPTQASSSTKSQSSTNASSSSVTVSFTNDVLPIFNNSCIDCHGKRQVKAGLDLQTYDKVMAGSFQHIVIVPGDADGSFLIQQIVNGKMPKQGAKLTNDQIKIISDWINEGALNN